MCSRSNRSDGQGIGADRADVAAGQARRQATDACRLEVMNAILYIASSGCQWQMLPTKAILLLVRQAMRSGIIPRPMLNTMCRKRIINSVQIPNGMAC